MKTFTSECVDIYQLNKIIFKKQLSSISMMESCNTAEQTSKILLDAHFPGSTEIGQIHPTGNQVDMDAANLDRDTDILHYQYNTVLDKNLDDLSFLNPLFI